MRMHGGGYPEAHPALVPTHLLPRLIQLLHPLPQLLILLPLHLTDSLQGQLKALCHRESAGIVASTTAMLARSRNTKSSSVRACMHHAMHAAWKPIDLEASLLTCTPAGV